MLQGFLSLDRGHLHLSRGLPLGTGGKPPPTQPQSSWQLGGLSCHDGDGLTRQCLLLSWEKQGKQYAMKFTDDTNLGGAGYTNPQGESKQSVEGEVRNPRQMITKRGMLENSVC